MVDIGSAVGYLLLDTTGWTRGFAIAGTALQRFTADGATAATKFAAVGEALSSVGQIATIALTTPLVAVGATAVKTAATFEAGMSEVAAISGATGKELDAMSAKAISMGQTTQFTASQAAEAFKFMAQAGWDTNDMLNSLEGVMYLASAAGVDLGTATSIMTDAMTALGLAADGSTKGLSNAMYFADILAVTANKTNTDVEMLGESFKYVATVAGTLKYSAEDLGIALGLMANNGVKGSQAGTTLRQALMSMISPTKEAAVAMEELGLYSDGVTTAMVNTDGTIKPLRGTIGELRTAFGALTDAQKAQYASTIFGARSMSGMLAIINSAPEVVDELAGALDNSAGAAKEMADIMVDNLQGSFQKAKAAGESLGAAFGKIIIPKIVEMIDWVTKLMNKLSGMSEEEQRRIINIGLIVAAIGPVLVILGKLTSGIGSLITIMTSLGAAGMATIGWVGLVVAALGLLVAAIIQSRDEEQKLADSVIELQGAMKATDDSLAETKQSFEESTAAIDSTASKAEQYIAKLEELEAAGLDTEYSQQKYKAVVEDLNTLIPELNIVLDEQTGLVQGGTEAILDQVESWKDLAYAKAMQDKYSTLLSTQLDYVIQQKQAQKELNTLMEEAKIIQMTMGTFEFRFPNIDSMVAAYEMMAVMPGVWQQLTQEQKEYTKGYIELTERLDANQASQAALKDMLGEYNTKIKDTEALLNSAASAMELYTDAATGAGDSTADAAGQMVSFEEVLAIYGYTLEDVANKTDEVADRVVDAFNRMTSGTKISLDDALKNLQENYKTQENWSSNMQLLYERTGRLSTYNLLNYMEKLGPEGAILLEALVNAGDEKLLEFEEAITNGMDAATKAALIELGVFPGDVENILNGLDGIGTAAGDMLMKGLNDGIATGAQAVYDTVAGVAATIGNTLDMKMEIMSPSKMSKRSGRYFTLGLIEGILSEKQRAKDATGQLVAALSGGMDKDWGLILRTFADKLHDMFDWMAEAMGDSKPAYRPSEMITPAIPGLPDYARPGEVGIPKEPVGGRAIYNEFTFYSPVAIDEVEAARQLKRAQQELALMNG